MDFSLHALIIIITARLVSIRVISKDKPKELEMLENKSSQPNAQGCYSSPQSSSQSVFLQISVIPSAAAGRRYSGVGERLHGWILMVEIIPRVMRIVHRLIIIETIMWIAISSRWHVVVRIWEVTIHWLKKKNRKCYQHLIVFYNQNTWGWKLSRSSFFIIVQKHHINIPILAVCRMFVT